jgi:outer membrane protein assembly factor BamB
VIAMEDRPLPSPETLQQLWRFKNSYGSLSPAQQLVPAGDRLLGVSGSTLFAVDIFRGHEPVPDAQVATQGFPYTFKSFYGGDPYVTAAGGVAYFMDGDALIALRLSDGLPLRKRNKDGKWVAWESPILQQVSGLLAVEDKVVAVHIGDSGATEVSAFTAVNGERAFGPVVISDLSPGRIAYGDGAVFFIAEGKLHAVNVDFGDARFARTKGGVASEALSPSAAPCVARDVVVAAGAALHFFDVKTGAEVFTPIAPTKPRAAWNTPILADKGRLVIACNAGEIVALRTSDGQVAWRNTQFTEVGEPTLNRNQVLVTTDRRSMLAVLSATTGAVERRMRLPEIAGSVTPVVTNETVFVPDASGWIEARFFAKQHAAYFDGRTSCIDVEADDEQFDFATGDFTVEAWIRSSEGGEIVSSHPTLADSDAHGFRLNLGQNGELRVAVTDADETRVYAGRTRPTRANDGEWHHVALIRRDGALLALLDGKAHDVFFRDDSQAGLSIGGRAGLTIGAYRPGKGKEAGAHFQGLIRELRLWDRALDVATVQNNRHVQLTGAEPRLKGLWSLAEVHGAGKKTEPKNAVDRHTAKATFLNAASTPTDLSLDRSGFPYLLHEVESHWPYAGTWAARGEQAVSSAAAIGDSAVAFATNNALYAVRRADGRRLWQLDMPRGVSAPVVDGTRFLALTGDDGVITVDAMTGESARVDAFAGLMKETGTALTAPALSDTHMAAGAPHGVVRVWPRNTSAQSVRDVALPAPVRELTLSEDRLFVVCGADGALQIASIGLADGSVTLFPVSNGAFAADDEWLFCVRDGKLTRIAPSQPARAPVQAKALAGGAVTGMATRGDDDLLVVTTDNGRVHGIAMGDLTERWTANLPDGRKRGSSVVHSPVFDAAGRVYCTTASGMVAVLDPATGARVGLYMGGEAIVSPPALAAATAYYGCADPDDPKAYRDGALHSVVFGETMVLRLGLDERGAPSRARPYGVVDIDTIDVDRHTLHLMDPTRSCVEAWVNIPTSRANSARRPGGGILGICPTLAGGFDLNLSVDEDGTLHYSARALRNGAWRMLRADAATSLADGQWHHVAVSRERADRAIIYVDGQALPNVAITQSDDAPQETVNGLKAFLGANAGDQLEAERPFSGMIAEVRVWDTDLAPAELTARMHVKLRGNEPDLLAYWNFDLESVEDAGPEQHHGVLTAVGVDPVWWLSDLAFEKPSYPFVTTAGKILQQEPGQPAIYEVAFTVHRADGSGLPGHALDLWYVRRRDTDPAETLFDGTAITGVRPAEEPEPGAASGDGKDRVFSVTTGNNGTTTVLITPTRAGHTPAIDLRAGFMARNGRLHVNVLLDQAMVAPPPPTLVVQSKLIQDYSYSSGGVINENRDRSTWRTVIRAVNPNGSVRIAEPISLWGGAQMTVDVAGHSYAVNKENSAELATDGQGELVVVFDASALTAPSLMARAGFMHRNDRLVIAPDQDLHRTLSTVSGSDFTEKRPTRWKPGMKEDEGDALLSGDYAPHANKVAGAIVTVMAAAKPADAEPAAAPRGGAQLLRSKARAKAYAASGRRLLRAEEQVPDEEAMRQPVLATGGDRVVTLRTMGHAPSVMPVNPDGLRAALADNAGFVFETITDKRGKPGIRFEMLETRAQVDDERGEPTPQPVLLRGWFDDLWSDIKDVAVDIYEGAVKVVVSIGEAIEVAIHKMVEGIEKIVHVVVDGIVEAVNAVAGFFEQLGVLIMKAIEFLRALFNWKAILRTKVIIHDLFVMSVEDAKKAMTPARIDALFLPLIGAGAMKPPAGGQSISATSAAGGEARSPAVDEARGVQGQMVMQKSRDSSIGASSNAGTGPSADAGGDAFSDLIRTLPNVVSGLVDLSPADMIDKLYAILKAGIDASVRLFIAELKAMSAVAVELVDWAMKLLRTEINIPFVSELYYWITGSRLTLLDLICLALAVPVHIAHIAVTTLMGHTSTFADDNHDLVARVKASRSGTPLPPRKALKLASPAPSAPAMLGAQMPTPQPMETKCETLIIVMRSINIAAGLASDVMFTRTVSAGGIGAASQGEARVRGLAKVIKGASGILAAHLMSHISNPAFEARLRSGCTPEVWKTIEPMPWVNEAIFGVQVAGDVITFGGGFKQLFFPSMPQVPGADGAIPGDAIDRAEFQVARVAAVGCIAAISVRTYLMFDTIKKLEDARVHGNVVKQVALFGARDISTVIARMPWFMFTQTGANRMIRAFAGAPTLYAVVTGVRTVAQGIALGTHVTAVYMFGHE